MKNKVLSTIFKSVIIFIFALLVIPTNTYAATDNWSLKDVGISNVVIDENNKITGYVVHLDIDIRNAGEARGYIGIQKVPFVDCYDDNTYGDFTNMGKVAYEKGFGTLADVTNDTDFMNKYGIMGFSSNNGEGFPIFGKYNQIEREFTNLDIQLYESCTYYVYLWTHYLGEVYPDALIGKIEFDGNGKIGINDSNDVEKNSYYTLKYETNGGSKIASKSIKNNSKSVEPTTNPTREGFQFDGWYADEKLETSFDFNTEITSNTTVYAKWKKNLSEITDLTFKGYNGLYDGKAHSIIVDGDTDAYTILYSLDGKNYDLSEAPKYTNVGNYTIYYKATKEGYKDLVGNVNINIKENKQEDKNDVNQNNQGVEEPNPPTGDNIILWIVTGLLSFIGLIIIFTKNIRKI